MRDKVIAKFKINDDIVRLYNKRGTLLAAMTVKGLGEIFSVVAEALIKKHYEKPKETPVKEKV